VVVLGELEAEEKAARVAVGELEALDRHVGEGSQEQSRIRGLNVLVNVCGSLLEDEGPEVGDLGNELLTLGVEILAELVLVANWETRWSASCVGEKIVLLLVSRTTH
jgi:hypothetical protein